MKTNELTGAALDWAVAKASHLIPIPDQPTGFYYWEDVSGLFVPSEDWAIGGPIIEREGISIIRADDGYGQDAEGFTTNERIPVWCAAYGQQSTQTSTDHQPHEEMFQVEVADVFYGPTPLVAAMRLYVAVKLGDTIDVPVELLEHKNEQD